MTKGENVMKELRKVFCVFAVFVLMLSLGIVGHAETGFNHALTFSISYNGNDWTPYSPTPLQFGGFDKTYITLENDSQDVYLKIDSFVENNQQLDASDIHVSFQNDWGVYSVELDSNKCTKIPASVLNQSRDSYSYLSIQSAGLNNNANIDFGEKSGSSFDRSLFAGTYVDSKDNSIVIDKNGKVTIQDMTVSDNHLDSYHIIHSDGSVKYNHQLYVYTYSTCLLFNYDQKNSIIEFEQIMSNNTQLPSFLYKGAKFKKEIQAEKITLNKSKLLLENGKEFQLLATISPSQATSKIMWITSDSSIAEINEQGVVQGLKEGNAVITASSAGQSATCNVTVVKPIIISSLPAIDESLDSTQVTVDQKSLEVLKELLNSVIDSNVPEGAMSSDTINAIEQALTHGKPITIEPTAKMIDKNSIDQVTIDKIEILLDNLSLQNKSQIKITQYLDLSVVLKTGSDILGNVSVLPNNTEWTVKIQQNLLSNQRKFHIIRVHNGNAELLPVTIQNDMISFQTDRFSTYAIAYEEEMEITQNFHTVTFVYMNNHILKTENVRHGEAATPPLVPYVEGYEFVKWDDNYQNVVKDMTIKAIYKPMKSNDNSSHLEDKDTVRTEDSTLFIFYLISLISSLFVLGYYTKTKNH